MTPIAELLSGTDLAWLQARSVLKAPHVWLLVMLVHEHHANGKEASPAIMRPEPLPYYWHGM